MKRHGNLWEPLIAFRNLVDAAHKAAQGKRQRPNVARFRFHLEPELCRLQEQLLDHSWRPGEYRTFEIHEPKRRLISAAPFRDRVIHHALCNVLEPIFERTFIHDSYACRKGKGTHAAVDRFQHFARGSRFVLKCDLRKFFPSVDHEILKQVLARKIKDSDVLRLVSQIIDGSNPQETMLDWFPGDDLLTPSERRRGLPIGNQTSQFFANALLNPFDHFVVEQLRPAGYLRYVDDFVLFSDDKAWLSEARTRCREFLLAMRLRLHPHKSVISPTSVGIRFLGYRVFPDCIRLPREHLVRWRRKLRVLRDRFATGAVSAALIGQRVASWNGHASQANSWRLRADILNTTLFHRRHPVGNDVTLPGA